MDLRFFDVFATWVESIDPRLWEILHPHVAHLEELLRSLSSGL